MNIIKIICLGMGVIAVMLALLPGPKNEDRLFKFFIFAIVVCACIFFGGLISKIQN